MFRVGVTPLKSAFSSARVRTRGTGAGARKSSLVLKHALVIQPSLTRSLIFPKQRMKASALHGKRAAAPHLSPRAFFGGPIAPCSSPDASHGRQSISYSSPVDSRIHPSRPCARLLDAHAVPGASSTPPMEARITPSVSCTPPGNACTPPDPSCRTPHGEQASCLFKPAGCLPSLPLSQSLPLNSQPPTPP